MFDNHIHSSLSADSELSPETAVKIAIDKKLIGIAFTEHIDFEMPGFDDLYHIDFENYFHELTDINDKYKSKLIIIQGVEIGQTPHTYERNIELLNIYNFDYVLSAVHVVNGEDLYMESYFEGKGKKKSYELYLESIYNALANFQNFDMFAHLDYVSRKAPYKDKLMKYMDYSDYFDEIFKKLISMGKGFEVNTGLNKYLPFEVAFDIDILKRYKELGGEKICIGSDSHDKERIGSSFEFCIDILKQTDFHYLTYFINRKPKYLKIK